MINVMSQELKTFDMEAEKQRLDKDPHFTDNEKAEILEYEDTVKGLLIHKVYIKLNKLFDLENNNKVMAKLLVLREGELDNLYIFISMGNKTKREIEDKINELVQR